MCKIQFRSSFNSSHLFLYRSSHQRCSIKIGFLKNFAKFTGKHLFYRTSLEDCFCMYSQKIVHVNCITKLRDNRIFKVLLRIKKLFKCINFDLAKHVLVFKVNHRWNLFENIQIFKLR